MADEELARIVGFVCEIGKIPPGKLGPDDDFYDAGMSSIQVHPLMLDLEDAFEVQFVDGLSDKIRTPRAIHDLIQSLRAGQ